MTITKERKESEKKTIERFVPYGMVGAQAFESVHVDGQPRFLCYDGKNISVQCEVKEFEDDKTRYVLRPVTDFPYEKYNFTREELGKLSTTTLEGAMGIAYETIFNTIDPFVDTDPQNKHIDSAAILFSYFQHKYKSTPYIFKIGAPESGKTRSLRLVKWLAYRPMMAVAMTNANIYRYLGKDVDAAGTIIHDEAEDIHKSNDMLSIYNDGYTLGSKVPRITGEHREDQSYYFGYCIKFYGGTHLPENNAFVSRCIVQQFMQGTPEKIDIEDEDEEEFRRVRKGLLVLRLLKSLEKKLPAVNTGLRGRSRELYAPLLAVVQGTDWYKVLLNPLLELDKQRREADRESKPGYVAKAVIDCWVIAARTELNLPETVELSLNFNAPLEKRITKPLFVPNDFVIASLGLQETTNEKGRKILISEELPFVLTRWEIGKIESENLKGKTGVTKIDKKSVRGHLFDAKTIKQLHLRYAATLVTHDSGTESPENTSEDAQIEHENGVQNSSTHTQASVTCVSSVAATQGIQCPYCSRTYATAQEVVDHGINAHPKRAIVAALAARRIEF